MLYIVSNKTSNAIKIEILGHLLENKLITQFHMKIYKIYNFF